MLSLVSNKGFGARVFDEGSSTIEDSSSVSSRRGAATGTRLPTAKYINSKGSVLFSKRHTLFGLDVARRAITQAGYALLVEGYMDVLSLHSMGFRNSVAALGTAVR